MKAGAEMTTNKDRLDACIDKYEELFAKLMAIGDYLASIHDDCPYFTADGESDGTNRAEKKMAVAHTLWCPPECEGYGIEGEDTMGCWETWVLKAEGWWWTV